MKTEKTAKQDTPFVNLDFHRVFTEQYETEAWDGRHFEPFHPTDAAILETLNAGIGLRFARLNAACGCGACVYLDGNWRFVLRVQDSRAELLATIHELAAVYNFCIATGRYPEPGENYHEKAA
jgi:hypothetical protein